MNKSIRIKVRYEIVLGVFLLAAVHVQSQGYSNPYYIESGFSNNTVFISGYYGTGSYPVEPTNLIIPASISGYAVTGLANYALYFLPNLTNVTIPATVTYIGTNAFPFSNNLLSINVDPSNPALSSVDGVLFDKEQTTLIQFPGGKGGSYVIPPSVTNMLADAFVDCVNLTNITIPDTITDFAEGLFAGDSRLPTIVIPDSVTNMGDGVFSECGGLTNLILPPGLASIGVSEFSYCANLTALTIPDSVTSIGNLAFQYSGLVSITIPDGVTNIGNEAFCYSPNLARVTIGSGLTGMGAEVFSYCPALTAFQVDSNNTAFMSADGVLFDRNGTLIQISAKQTGGVLHRA